MSKFSTPIIHSATNLAKFKYVNTTWIAENINSKIVFMYTQESTIYI